MGAVCVCVREIKGGTRASIAYVWSSNAERAKGREEGDGHRCVARENWREGGQWQKRAPSTLSQVDSR
jgi:hypothetical protein